MGILNVQLIVHPDCKITAIDDNSYLKLPGNYSALVDSLKDYTSIEYLKYKDESIAKDSITIEKFDANRSNVISNTVFPIYRDGMYAYYKFMIPRLEFLFVESESNPNLYTEICLYNQTFYYMGNIYLYKGDGDIIFDSELTRDQALSLYKTDILSKSKMLNYEELYDNLGSQSFSCKKIVFTICNLIKCFVSLQHEIVAKLSANYCYNTESQKRDFLLSTIYVLDYLKDINNFAEAQRIIDSLEECNILCVNNNTGCCCDE